MAGTTNSSSSSGGQQREPSSLSQLCSICHTAAPKYTCPRCTTHTCSLTCSQRHKRWAQCSGVRDPAAYVKRSDLANDAAAFDRDFNFLTGVERAVERAGRVVREGWVEDPALMMGEGEGVDDGGGGGMKKKKVEVLGKGEVPFLRGVEESGVGLVRAPRGMARRRENESAWSKKQKCINWLIEWVLPDGTKERSKSVEILDVGTAFGRTALGGRGIEEVEKKSRDTTGSGSMCRPRKKRKVGAENGATVTKEKEHTGEGSQAQAEAQEREDRNGGEEDHAALNHRPRRGSSCTLSPEPVDHQRREYHFYLHRPRSRSKVPVLIPLARSTTLANALRGRTVLEFPTVYVLEKDLAMQDDDDEEVLGYMLEAAYLAENPEEREGKEEGEGEGEAVERDRDEDKNITTGLDALVDVDEGKVLQAMQKDLGAEELLS